MPVTKQQYDAVMKVARANSRELHVDLPRSSKHEIHLVNKKKQKRWIVDGAGKVHKG
jgi:hypothetical protein